MKIYSARLNKNSGLDVTVDSHPLDPRLDLWYHSIAFACGFAGEGAAQLSLALLADCLQNDQKALALYQQFKWKIVPQLPREGWTVTQDELLVMINESCISAWRTIPARCYSQLLKSEEFFYIQIL